VLFISTTTIGFLRQFSRAFYATEIHSRIIRVREPVESPVTSRLQLRRQLAALGLATDSTILCTPTVLRRTPLTGASIEKTYATAWNHQIEMILAQIAAGVGNLNNHRFAVGRATGKFQFVASATPIGFGFSGQVRRREPVSQISVYGPRLIRIASVARAATATTGRVHVDRISSVLLTRLDRSCEWTLAVPTAAHFATVPIASGFTRSGWRTGRLHYAADAAVDRCRLIFGNWILFHPASSTVVVGPSEVGASGRSFTFAAAFSDRDHL